MQSTLKKTLIIRFSSVGDVILSSLLLRVFRKRFPDTQVDYLVKSEFADLVRYNPNVTTILEFPGRGSFRELQHFRRRIHAAHYDLIVDIHDSLRSRFLTFSLSNVVRINKRKIARYLLVRFKLNLYEKLGGAPGVALRYIEPVGQFGVVDDGEGPELFYPEEAQRQADSLLAELCSAGPKRFIGICPSAKHNTKMWIPERFAESAIELAKKLDAQILLLGASITEVQRCGSILSMIRERAPAMSVFNLADKLSLLETAAVMDRCALIVSNDSGLMHLAGARKRNVVAIFGPTVKEFGFFPVGPGATVVENNDLDCRPCTHIGLPACPKGHFRCMNDISTDQVVQAAFQLLKN